MRIIDFRAWHKKYEYMERVADISFKRGIVNLNGADISKIEDVELMQYTGLKDKNEKKIFEGDIVRYYNDLYIIRFENGCFQFWQDCGGGDTYITIDGVLASSCEVVGNIWETKNG